MSSQAPSYSTQPKPQPTSADAPRSRQAWAIECNPLYALGAFCLMLGLGLWIGNLTNLLTTFRGSGFVAILLGFVLWHLGVCFPRRRRL